MSKYNIHTETCHQTDHTLWNGEWFAIGWRISPGHSDFFAFQIFNTTKFMDDVKHICHTLCWMVNIALKVYKSRSLLKDTIFISFCYSIHEFFLICMSFTDIHIITNTDYISHERNHICCFTNCFAMGNLRFLFIQILHFQTKKVTCGCKRETCTCGVITEDRDSKTAFEYFCGNIIFSHETKSISNCEYSFQFIICFIPCPEEIVVVHFFEV